MTYKNIIYEGLWKNNPGFVQLLGLCPLLAVTSTLINGLGLGIATTLILMASNVTVSLIRTLTERKSKDWLACSRSLRDQHVYLLF